MTHGPPRQEAGTVPGSNSLITKLCATKMMSRMSMMASRPLQYCVLGAYLHVFHVADLSAHLRKHT